MPIDPRRFKPQRGGGGIDLGALIYGMAGGGLDTKLIPGGVADGPNPNGTAGVYAAPTFEARPRHPVLDRIFNYGGDAREAAALQAEYQLKQAAHQLDLQRALQTMGVGHANALQLEDVGHTNDMTEIKYRTDESGRGRRMGYDIDLEYAPRLREDVLETERGKSGIRREETKFTTDEGIRGKRAEKDLEVEYAPRIDEQKLRTALDQAAIAKYNMRYAELPPEHKALVGQLALESVRADTEQALARGANARYDARVSGALLPGAETEAFAAQNARISGDVLKTTAAEDQTAFMMENPNHTTQMNNAALQRAQGEAAASRYVNVPGMGAAFDPVTKEIITGIQTQTTPVSVPQPITLPNGRTLQGAPVIRNQETIIPPSIGNMTNAPVPLPELMRRRLQDLMRATNSVRPTP